MTQWEKGQHSVSNLTLLFPSWVNLDRSLHFLSCGIFSLLTKCRNLITDLRGLFWLKEWVISPSSPWCWALVLGNLAFLPFSPFPLPFCWNAAHNVSHTYPSYFFPVSSCAFSEWNAFSPLHQAQARVDVIPILQDSTQMLIFFFFPLKISIFFKWAKCGKEEYTINMKHAYKLLKIMLRRLNFRRAKFLKNSK